VLLELTIRDFAIIDELKLSWQPGLSALTGETGAGKSIIVDAVGALLGDRLGPEVVRAGRTRASVEGIFALDRRSEASRALRDLLSAHELLDDEDQVIVAREIARAGRGVARVNGRAVPLALLQQVGEHLVDVHGQSQHLSLLRPREHLEYLDRFAGLLEVRVRVADLVQRWRAVQAERRRLLDEIRVAARERELLRHEVAEIESADLRPGEEEELQALRQRLRHATRLREAAEQAILALQGADEARGAVDLLGEASAHCRDASRADVSLESAAEVLERLASEAEEAARDLRHYLDRLEADPRQLEDAEARSLTIADLKRKYGESVEAVLDYLAQARARLATVERGDELLAELDERERGLRAEVSRAALELSGGRTRAADGLRAEVERELQDLNMSGARFAASLERQADPAGIEWPGSDGEPTRVAVDSSGADRLEFLFSANPGEPPRGLGRIASGGELARVALALKAVLARVDQRGTLIFDEIDVGVGGRSASVVGQKLWRLTGTHQVLCITHMPQVAAYADQHFVVAKRSDGATTSTAVEPVSGPKRVAELAAMLGGEPESEAAEANARELIARSESWKRANRAARKAG
jgi:DNA repair protein RecN (Recombination protein N)